MRNSLPIILSAGVFDSSRKFPNITVTSPRKVTTYELEYFFEDGGTTIVNGTDHPVKGGKLLFAKPGDIRYSRLPFRCKFIHFSVSDAAFVSVLDGIDTICEGLNTSKVDAVFSEITAQFYSADPFDNINAEAELISLLHYICNHADSKINTISKAREFIESNYTRGLTTESIAEACSISVSYLHKLFRTQLNTTPADFLLNCRISAARDLLVNTSLPLGEIAFQCGFHSQSYFSDCFRKRVGMTPGQFRKQAAYVL